MLWSWSRSRRVGHGFPAGFPKFHCLAVRGSRPLRFTFYPTSYPRNQNSQQSTRTSLHISNADTITAARTHHRLGSAEEEGRRGVYVLPEEKGTLIREDKQATRLLANFPFQIKCNAEKPTCANCKIYGKDCVFEPLDASRGGDHESPAAPRRSLVRGRAKTGSSSRTHVQASPARETNGGTRGGSRNGDKEGTARALGGDSAGDDSRPETDRDAAPASQTRAGVSGIVVSPDGVSSYHGQTSTHFEENLQERAPAGDARPRMPDDWIEKGLVAEAAKQRTFPDPVLYASDRC